MSKLAYVMQNKMTYVQVRNAAGKFVSPSLESFQAAAATANWSAQPDFNIVITNAPGEESWPIAASVFVMMYKTPQDAARSKDALAFFKWTLEKGQDDAKSLLYVALPDGLVRQIESLLGPRKSKRTELHIEAFESFGMPPIAGGSPADYAIACQPSSSSQ